MAQSMEVLTKETQEIKIEDDILLGNDLSFEQKFLNNVNDILATWIQLCNKILRSFSLEKGTRHAANGKKGEAICSNELVNLFKDKKHKGCHCSTV